MAVIVKTTYGAPVLYRNASDYRIDHRGDLHVVNRKGRIGSIQSGRWVQVDIAQNRDARGRFTKQEN
ncbi:hypothetical protein I5J49_gp45 [Mycobacterium phage ThulaThula]|uniref:Uncharacterized protein n=1 Tax=Mycobacterium phage ThulaThula TaxID=2599880 RepID=A0A5J6TDS9_9CAUD|nr:hypothetical protein I5J49_gp45 [Mycobacterium phage ThulaThula]QFG09073.1 hypothetical protein PBI_THULATHULA_45 [Mycobacterium phage ThulaThula]